MMLTTALQPKAECMRYYVIKKSRMMQAHHAAKEIT